MKKQREQFNLDLWNRLKEQNIPHTFETRGGIEVTQLAYFSEVDENQIRAVRGRTIFSWDCNGRFGSYESTHDLFICWEEEQLYIEGWLLVYMNDVTVFKRTRDDFDKRYCIAQIPIKIPYTKGEGL